MPGPLPRPCATWTRLRTFADISLDERLRVIQYRLFCRTGRRGMTGSPPTSPRHRPSRSAPATLEGGPGLRGAVGPGRRVGRRHRPRRRVPGRIEAARALGDPVLAARLQRPLQAAVLARGEHAEASRRAEESLRLIRAANLPMLEVMPRFVAGFAAFQAGVWDEAAAPAGAALVVAIGWAANAASLRLALRALVAVHRGEYADAEAGIAEARVAFGQGDRNVSGIARHGRRPPRTGPGRRDWRAASPCQPAGCSS